MYHDIAEFERFYQTKLGQNVAELIRRQLGLFWHVGSPLSLAFLGYAQPFLDPKPPIPLGLMPARRGAAAWHQEKAGHIPKRPMTGVIRHARTGQAGAG